MHVRRIDMGIVTTQTGWGEATPTDQRFHNGREIEIREQRRAVEWIGLEGLNVEGNFGFI